MFSKRGKGQVDVHTMVLLAPGPPTCSESLTCLQHSAHPLALQSEMIYYLLVNMFIVVYRPLSVGRGEIMRREQVKNKTLLCELFIDRERLKSKTLLCFVSYLRVAW